MIELCPIGGMRLEKYTDPSYGANQYMKITIMKLTGQSSSALSLVNTSPHL